MTSNAPRRLAAWVRRPAAGLLAVVAGAAALLFVAASAYGGFVFRSDWVRVSLRHPWRALIPMALAWLAREALLRRGRAGAAGGAPPVPAPAAPQAGRGGCEWMWLGAVLFAGLLLWAQVVFACYQRVLMRWSTVPARALADINLVFAGAGVVAVAAWFLARRALGAAAALAASAWALAALLFFEKSPPVAAGAAAAPLLWAGASLLVARRRRRARAPVTAWRARASAAGYAAGALAAGAIVAHVWFDGWAGDRMLRPVLRQFGADAGVWLLAAGAAALLLRRAPLPAGFAGAALLAAPGLGLAGGRAAGAAFGAMLALPLAALLAGAGVAGVRRCPWVRDSVLGRNLALLVFLGLLLGMMRMGLYGEAP